MGRNGENRVLINFEGHVDLGNSAGSWGDAVEVELAEHVIVLDKGAFAFEDRNSDGSLLVLVGGEGLGLLGGDNSTARDDLGHHAANSLNAQSEGGHIDEKQILGLFAGLASEDASLNSSAIGYSLVGVNSTVGFLSIEEFLDELLHLGDTGGATNQHNLVDF